MQPSQGDESEVSNVDTETLLQEVESKRSEFEKNLPSNLIFK